MIFQTPGAIDKIIAGTKTQTRRLVLPGENCHRVPIFGNNPTINAVLRPSSKPELWHAKYEVGHDYAVQPGRGKPGVWWYEKQYGDAAACSMWVDDPVAASIMSGFKPLRIRITAIRHEDVRAISKQDAIAEGDYTPAEYFNLWLRLNNIRTEKRAKDAKNFDVWALTFEVVKHNFESTSAVLRERAD